VLVKMLDRPGALEYEIGAWIADAATARAHDLFAADEGAPEGNDLWDRAVRGVYQRLAAARDAQAEAERLSRYAETDRYLARVKAGLE
jgi:hypothetical protein